MGDHAGVDEELEQYIMRRGNGLVSVGILVYLLSACSAGGGTDDGTKGQAPVPDPAGTINAASCSRTDVGTAVSSAVSGTKVIVPAGSCLWNATLTLTRGIVLQGAGVDMTVITSTVLSGFDASIIRYEVANPSLNEPVRITGFTFDGNWNSGCVYFVRSGYSNSITITNVRMDHNRFTRCGSTSFPGRALLVDGLTFGVIDHNIFLNNQKTFDDEDSDCFGWPFDAVYSPCGSGPAITMGGANSMYFEDNELTNNDTRSSLFTSGGQGGRYVIRYNTFNSVGNTATGQHFDIHAEITDSGTVSAEIYNNTLTTNANAYQFVDHRGGTARIFNNKIIKSGSIDFQMR